MIRIKAKKRIKNKIEILYGKSNSENICKRIESIVSKYKDISEKKRESRFSEKDSILITYADSIKEKGKKPLKTFRKFSRSFNNQINSVHFLPFFPYSSDDGFSVIDYRQIDPKLGTWKDVKEIGKESRLMFDFVLNHMSIKSHWFREFMKDNPRYKDYFIEADENEDVSKVFRPRTHPLITKIRYRGYEKNVWTTFSEDQADLNFKNPEVLLEIIDIMLFFVKNNARLLRFDAIAYVWKKRGTKSIHLKETHALIKLLRDILDEVNPNVLIVTETNVPHKENISYFGNKGDEAQMVYQFPLPPLVLHAILRQDSRYLIEWLDSIGNLPEDITFFNFLASHDGIGVLPAKGLIPDKEIDFIAKKVKEHKGHISYKSNSDGSKVPYELNINYFDALSDPDAGETEDMQSRRFMASQAVMLSLAGVPGIYVHSLLGSRSWHSGVKRSGIKRRINREKISYERLSKELKDDCSIRKKVFDEYKRLLEIRKKEKAFHPDSRQKAVKFDRRLFTIARESKKEKIEVIINLTDKILMFNYDAKGKDLVSGERIDRRIVMQPYQAMWVKSRR